MDALPTQLPLEVVQDARLVLSELVTNSFKYAGNPPGHPIRIGLTVKPDALRIEVIDGSVFDPTPETSEELREVRWGLVLLDRVVDDWGRISEGGIWAEFRLDRSEG